MQCITVQNTPFLESAQTDNLIKIANKKLIFLKNLIFDMFDLHYSVLYNVSSYIFHLNRLNRANVPSNEGNLINFSYV